LMRTGASAKRTDELKAAARDRVVAEVASRTLATVRPMSADCPRA
jgi:hypothetical protein